MTSDAAQTPRWTASTSSCRTRPPRTSSSPSRTTAATRLRVCGTCPRATSCSSWRCQREECVPLPPRLRAASRRMLTRSRRADLVRRLVAVRRSPRLCDQEEGALHPRPSRLVGLARERAGARLDPAVPPRLGVRGPPRLERLQPRRLARAHPIPPLALDQPARQARLDPARRLAGAPLPLCRPRHAHRPPPLARRPVLPRLLGQPRAQGRLRRVRQAAVVRGRRAPERVGVPPQGPGRRPQGRDRQGPAPHAQHDRGRRLYCASCQGASPSLFSARLFSAFPSVCARTPRADSRSHRSRRPTSSRTTSSSRRATSRSPA